MASTIRGSDNFDSGDVPTDIQGARAWVRFDGTGVVAITDDYNVSSITDNGTGSYDINFTTALNNANCCALGSCNSNNAGVSTKAFATTDVEIATYNTANNLTDFAFVNVAVFSS